MTSCEDREEGIKRRLNEMNVPLRAVVGDPASEMQAIQILALTLSNAAAWAAANVQETPRNIVIPPLLASAAKVISLTSIEALSPPLPILALCTRNIFELYLRLRHILVSDANCQQWRSEAVTDQLQIYEGIRGLDGPESAKAALGDEVERVKKHAKRKGLGEAKITRISDLARQVDRGEEYEAFFKLYSKFVHPSSFAVNWPSAASAPMYRDTFIFNLQIYGHLILEEVKTAIGLPNDELISKSRQEYEEALSRSGPHS